MAEDRDANIAKGCFTLIPVAIVAIFVVVMLGPQSGRDSDPSRGRDVTWETFDVGLTVQEDGTIHVVETWDLRFHGAFSHGDRKIPMERIESIDNVRVRVEPAHESYSAPYMKSRPLVNAQQVDPDVSSPYPKSNQFTVEQTSSELIIKFGFDSTNEYADGSFALSPNGTDRTVVIEYDAHGAVRSYPDAAEPWEQIHWMAVSPDITNMAPVESSTVTLTLPSAPTHGLVTAPDPASSSGNVFTWHRTNLEKGSGFDVQAAFPRQTTAVPPSWQPDADARDESIRDAARKKNAGRGFVIAGGLVTAVAGGLALLGGWYRSIREPVVGNIPEYVTEPPDDLPAGLVGALVDESVQPRDLAAAILDFYRRGIVAIEKVATDSEATYQLRLLDRPTDLQSWETWLLERIFGADANLQEVAQFGRLSPLFTYEAADVQQRMDQALVDRGMYRELPSVSRANWSRNLKIALAVSFAIPVIIAVWAGAFLGWWMAIPPLVGVTMYVVGRRMTGHMAIKTLKGAESAALWNAFRRHLERDTSWSFGRVATSASQRNAFIAWSTAFGIDSSWLSVMNRDRYPSTRRSHTAAPKTSVFPGSGTTFGGQTSFGNDDHPGETTHRWPSDSGWVTGGGGWSSGSNWNPSNWGGIQSSSDTLADRLSSGSDSTFGMLGDMLASIGEHSGSSGSGGGSSFSSGSSSSSSSSGGSSSSSSGGGSASFG